DADLAFVPLLLRYHVAPNGTYFNNKDSSDQPIIMLLDEWVEFCDSKPYYSKAFELRVYFRTVTAGTPIPAKE
ncbi:MAG TPA: hypothetical protein V6C86_08220, partial [Oculatellaceae cyanobacterium]